jgi:hypothetical protein
MRTTTMIHYSVAVRRGDTMIDYNAERFPSRADARVFARRLHEYAEIRRVKTVLESSTVERVEPIEA